MFSDAVDILLSELGLWKDCPMYLSVNNHCNVGFTESMVLLESAAKQIEERKIKLCGCAAGTYFDVFDGKGCILSLDRKSTRLNSSHLKLSRMPSSA